LTLLFLSFIGNYAEAGKALGVDLLLNPDQVAQSDKLAAATALWYWNEKKMSESAKQGHFGTSTKVLNPPECGAENERQKKRVQKYQSVRKCFEKKEETNNLMC
jgi:predicted chitinase